MSFKTERLVNLFPDAYAARDTESTLFKVLDTFGAELMRADAKVKELLKSHWVRYASGAALDGLGSVFGVSRRTLRDGRPESDDSFRRRLIATVPLFTGGGTVEAVKGAVRSAVGLPFDLAELGIPPAYSALLSSLERLVTLTEFSPVEERVIATSTEGADSVAEARIELEALSTEDALPRVEWTFTHGAGRNLVLERRQPGPSIGVRSLSSLLVPEGKTLVLTARDDGVLIATIDSSDVSASFLSLDGSLPGLPAVPVAFSEWRFRAGGGTYDVSQFDADSFAPPPFRVELQRVRRQRLTFDVEAPYFVEDAVAALKVLYQYPGELLVFEGVAREQLQQVIDQVKAAGVRGSLRFSLNFIEDQAATERHTQVGRFSFGESLNASEQLEVSDVTSLGEQQDTAERFAVGAVFDFSTFDQMYGFQ